jgi:hypothetical protein
LVGEAVGLNEVCSVGLGEAVGSSVIFFEVGKLVKGLGVGASV